MPKTIPSRNNFFLTFYYLVLSSRPKTLLVTLCPMVILYCYFAQIPNFNLPSLLIYTFSVLFMQIACNFTNEYYDYIRQVDNDKRLGPKRMLQQKKITLKEMKFGMVVSFFLSMLGSIYLSVHYGLIIFFLALISLLAAYFYTGGKNPYGYRGWGEILAFIFFGPVLFLVVFVMFYSDSFLFVLPSLKLPIILDYLIFSQAAGSFAWVIISINNLRDYKNDQEANKLTLTNIIGVRWVKIIMIIFLVAGNLLFYLMLNNRQNHLLYFSVFFIVFFIVKNILLEINLNQTIGLTLLNYLAISFWFALLY